VLILSRFESSLYEINEQHSTTTYGFCPPVYYYYPHSFISLVREEEEQQKDTESQNPM
jgi:hypothetical protein